MFTFFKSMNCCQKKEQISNDSYIVPSDNQILPSTSDSLHYNHTLSSNKEPIKVEHLSPKFSKCVEPSESITDTSGSQPIVKSPSILTFSNLQLEVDYSNDSNESSALNGNKLLLSGELFFNKEIIIDKNGMVNGMRKKKDGQTFFGLANSKDYTGTYYNDLVLNFRESSQNASSTGRVFDISYQKATNDYRLYMIHNSLIINYQINNLFYFDDDNEYYLVLGKVFMTVATRKNERKKFIDVIIETENENEEIKYTFSEDEIPITIGRLDCEIKIKNQSISKKHAVIEYSTECQKFYFRDLGSTNGSVVVIKEDDTIKLKGDMRFKLENVPFRIMELP